MLCAETEVAGRDNRVCVDGVRRAPVGGWVGDRNNLHSRAIKENNGLGGNKMKGVAGVAQLFEQRNERKREEGS